MPDLATKQELARAARTLAQSYNLIQRGTTTYIPVDWVTEDPDPPPTQGETIWLPLEREDKQRLGNLKHNILFANDSELRSFDFMIQQFAESHEEAVVSILVRTKQGLMELTEDGGLTPHAGDFTPNYLRPTLNENPDDKAEVFKVISEWLQSDDEAHSLLHHIATSLAPGYSAVKYVLLLGEGRNGKGVFLDMLTSLFGKENVSNVTRQMMAEKMPACAELNNKLLNVVFDGEMTYLRDSSMEKTLVAGETGVVRMLYESKTTRVRTNALFVEAVNLEPKNRDKSPALQKRMARFQFPNVYQLDHAFSRHMTSQKMLGAFLSLLIDHYVRETEVAEKLVLTSGSLELQMEQVWLGSPVLQFLEYLNSTDPAAVAKLVDKGMAIDTFLASFKPWAETQGMNERSDGDLVSMIKTAFEIGWKTIRVNKKPTNMRVIKAVRPETLAALEQMKGDTSGTQDPEAELVGD